MSANEARAQGHATEVDLPEGSGVANRVSLERARPALDLAEARNWLFTDGDELFRGIYTRAATGASEVLAVCSAIAGEGKTTISIGLGLTIAQDFPDRRVVVVETDIAKPVLAQDFDVEPNPGLVDCLLEGVSIQRAYRSTSQENLFLVPVGGPAKSAGRILRSSRLAAAIGTMRGFHDLVILDVPAVLVNSDALLLTDLADGILFVVRSGLTPASMVQKAIGELDESKLRGVILNGTKSAIPGWLRRLCGM